ncbi:MAG: hypothetical protein EZS28_017625 [Streblomastix strix]|uniref:Uncharacterized protein n=1 Tax=Streblomastix strix TaxID=222440 RepID=A0A5J4VW88_9EUKA|nr:MAG: hypothetical protein EZS28_017625 [Streblomastix strix]
MNHILKHKNHQVKSIGIAVVHSIGLLDNLETYLTALRGILKGVPVNYGLASSLNIVNNVQVDDDEVLGLECVTYIDIQALPLYVVTQPQANDSYIPRVNVYLIAYSIGGIGKGDTSQLLNFNVEHSKSIIIPLQSYAQSSYFYILNYDDVDPTFHTPSVSQGSVLQPVNTHRKFSSLQSVLT